jgi:hypothetical protein
MLVVRRYRKGPIMPRFLPLARRFALLALPFGLASSLLPGYAASAQPGGLQLAQGAEVGGFSQTTLEAYAAAVRKVQEVDRAWQPKFNGAETAEEIENLTRRATDEMVGEIEAQGLSVQEYNAITKAAQQDSRLYDHIMTLLAQAQ